MFIIFIGFLLSVVITMGLRYGFSYELSVMRDLYKEVYSSEN